MKMSPALKTAVALLVVGLLFAHPLSRRVIIVILPLGSGIDDLIAIVALGLAALLAFVQGWVSVPNIKKKIDDFFKTPEGG